MTNTRRDIKRRRTFTLSPASLTYLEEETRRRNAESQSAVLDELLQQKKRDLQLAALEGAIEAYYERFREAEEDKTWAEFAGMNLAKEEEVRYDQPTAGGNLVHETTHRPTGKRKAPRRDRLNQRTKQSSAR